MTLVAKIYQSQNFSNRDCRIFEASSGSISMKGYEEGVIKFPKDTNPTFYINYIGLRP